MDRLDKISRPDTGFPGKALETSVGAFYNGIRNRLFLREAAAFCAAALFLAGGGVLSWRLAFPACSRRAMIVFCIGLVLAAAAVALHRATRLTPSKRKLIVWLDACTGCGGLLASSLETDCSAWSDTFEIPQAPPLAMKVPVARLMALLIAAVFLAGAFLIDTDRLETAPRRLDNSAEIEERMNQTETLAQEQEIPQEEIAEIRDTIRKIREETDPAKAFGQLDAVREEINSLAANTAFSLEHSADNMKNLSQAAAALSRLPAGDKARSKAVSQFLQLAEKLAEDDSMLKDLLSKNGDLASALNGKQLQDLLSENKELLEQLASSLTPEQLQELAKLMSAHSGDLQKRIDALKKIRLDTMPQQTGQNPGMNFDPSLASGFNDPKALQQWLQENAPGENELIAACRNTAQTQGQTQGQGQTQAQGLTQAPGQGQAQGQGQTQAPGQGQAQGQGQTQAPGQGQAQGQGQTQGQSEGQSQGGGSDQIPAQGEDSGAGSGGVSRGPGRAGLSFSGNTQEGGNRNERPDLHLKRNTPGDERDVTVRETRTAPGEEESEQAQAGRLSRRGQTEHPDDIDKEILPSHRESVRRYREALRRSGNLPDRP